MKTFADLTPGSVLLYNDAANVDLKHTILETDYTRFGTFVIVLIETENGVSKEGVYAETEIDEFRWTVEFTA